MENRFDIKVADGMDDLALCVYTSRLMGQDQDLVLHGGGNTSVKIGDLLYVKGSGWDLGSIEKEGFSPTRIDDLLKLLKHEMLSDADMVTSQKAALTDKSAPNPSIEAILHALIPYAFVDHTHADAIVTISNTVNGEKLIEELYGANYLIIPYVMPGFVLAKKIHEMTRDVDWDSLKGMILNNHGVFTFSDDAKEAYDKMIETVAKAEAYLDEHAPLEMEALDSGSKYDMDRLEKELSTLKEGELVIRVNTSPLARHFASQDDEALYTKGVLTPEHIIRTKRFPAVLEGDIGSGLKSFVENYQAYFSRHATDEIMLNPAPNWAVLKGYGTVAIGKNEKEVAIIDDIATHTMKAILQGEKLGGYRSINEADSFAMEYWELEQMKLKSK